MARCLIIACGCRGSALASELSRRGHVVRGTTRDFNHGHRIEAAGAEPFVGDPDAVATLAPALEHVGVVCLLLGSATGTAAQRAALHGPRLEMLLHRVTDTTVRGIVYEAGGSVDAAVLERGGRIVRVLCERSRIPHVLVGVDPADHRAWVRAMAEAVDTVLLSPAL